MHLPIPGVIDDPRTGFDQPHDDPFDRPALVIAPQIEPADQMKQVVCEKAHFEPGFVCRESVATRLVSAQGVLAFLDPVFNVSPSIIHLDHPTRQKLRIGHD